MKLRWTRPALSDFIEAQDFIGKEAPEAAKRIAQRVWTAAQQLSDNPLIGRAGHVTGTREWVVTGTAFLIVYRIKNDQIEILRLWHGRRDWQNAST